ncbi:unnamed protein product (macronuclear) [Paramecium tetraurelia]|uniref:Protein kinase domain-containing protein n=1 Tax=Paramecium tetraurelia TaxID=5888 RepID=A0E699_PARTE|nr:uncharacterized protein GSPATT00003681001 [Paramecium tetraurelia]CAK90816.1 unnamed protein product [Paramecium tetraurelia]|eukprot:XP_001458213.1 hypothetical protein (macronuclear) [Paramecium tetraurelia strain d4-2]
MGSCSSRQMKQQMKAKIQESKQKQSQSATPNRQTTKINSIRSQSRHNTHTAIQSQNDLNQLGYSLKNINFFLIYRNTNFSSFYSLLKKEDKDNPFTTIQHNNAGTVRIIKSYKSTDSKYIAQLLKYQLHHPNLIQQFEIYEEQQKYHVAEENNNKIVVLNQKTFNDEKEIAFIFNQIVEVIEYLHHQNLTHGHLTMECFALFGDQYIKLYDLFHLFMKKKPTLEETHYLPPEYFDNQEYSEERDIWSLGIILYNLLYHNSPYESNIASLLKFDIKASNISYQNKISEEAISLLQQILEKNPKKRIRISEITKHPWFKKQQVFLDDDHIRETLQRLRLSKKLNILQVYLLKFIINNYPPDKLREIYSVFRSLDLDNDGFFSISELITSYTEYVEDSENTKIICMNIFQKVDMDKDKKITFQEFILYAFDRKELIEEEVITTSFKLLKNKKNFITAETLAVQYTLDKEYFTDMMNEHLKKDYITLKSFKELMNKIV